MEQRGLVERLRDDVDRRVVRVALAEGGRQTMGHMASERRERLSQILDQLTDAELEGFLAGLRGMRRARESLHAALEGQQPEGPPAATDEETTR
jgi:DNA-binding MarR family transcriptional regulator